MTEFRELVTLCALLRFKFHLRREPTVIVFKEGNDHISLHSHDNCMFCDTAKH